MSWDVIADRTTFNSNPPAGEATVIHTIRIDPKHSNVGYLGTHIGLFKSSNINTLSAGSVSWNLVHPGAIEDIEFTTDTTAVSTIVISYRSGGGGLSTKAPTGAGRGSRFLLLRGLRNLCRLMVALPRSSWR